MQPLPVNPYEPSLWSDQTVPLDYTVTDGLNKYSVPYDLIGESVSVRMTRGTVEVFFHGNRVAVHPREVSRRRDPVMITSHMPENHRQYLAYTKDDLQSWASTIGPNTERVVRFFLESGTAPEQGFKSCVSLKNMRTGIKLSESKRHAARSCSSPEILPSVGSCAAEISDKERGESRSVVH